MHEKDITPYEQGHVVVAAVRLFSHREGKMPTARDIAELTGLQMDLTLFLCNRLLKLGVLKMIKGAFDDRYHIGDHIALEALPKSVDHEAMVKEVEKFKADSVQKKKKLENMFTSGELDQKKKDRQRQLEDRLKDPSSLKRPNPLDALTRPKSETDEGPDEDQD